MVFTNKDFVDLLNFYKNQDNFPTNARKSFDTFTEVSKSDDDEDEFKDQLIIDDNCVFDLDNMCFNSHIMEKWSC